MRRFKMLLERSVTVLKMIRFGSFWSRGQIRDSVIGFHTFLFTSSLDASAAALLPGSDATSTVGLVEQQPAQSQIRFDGTGVDSQVLSLTGGGGTDYRVRVNIDSFAPTLPPNGLAFWTGGNITAPLPFFGYSQTFEFPTPELDVTFSQRGMAQVTFEALKGYRYDLLFSTDLADWKSVATVDGKNDLMSVEHNPVGVEEGYYAVAVSQAELPETSKLRRDLNTSPTSSSGRNEVLRPVGRQQIQ